MFGQHAHCRALGKRRCFARTQRVGGIKKKLLTFLALLLLVVGLLPLIVAKTPLRNVLLSSALPRDSIRVTIGDASLNWFGSPSLSTVEVKDAAGDTLLAAESIKIDRTPLYLAMNSHELGTIQIVRPVIHVKVRPDGPQQQKTVRKLNRLQRNRPRSFSNLSKQRSWPTISPLVANGGCKMLTHNTIHKTRLASGSVL
jgi:hypothetical protein